MAQIDNIADIAFTTEYPIDKIIWESSLESHASSAASTASPDDDSFTTAHTLGDNVVVTGVYSLDGVNFYPFGTEFWGAKSGVSLVPQYAYMNAYVNNTTVYFRTVNGYDTANTFRYYYWLESIA